jgi:hypothetical protein
MSKKKSHFDVDRCAIPTVYCGSGAVPERKKGDDKYYTGVGTPYQCMQKGFGAGMYSEKNKSIPKTSVQTIKYVGEVYERNFKNHKINYLEDLKKYANSHNEEELKELLKDVFDKSGGILDKRAYNSTLLYLYKNGVENLPQCKIIK